MLTLRSNTSCILMGYANMKNRFCLLFRTSFGHTPIALHAWPIKARRLWYIKKKSIIRAPRHCFLVWMNRAGHCEWLNTMYRHTPDNGHIINRSWWEEKRARKVQGREQEAFENRHDLAGNSNLAHNEREVRWINLISMFILNPFPWVRDPFSPDKINTVLRSLMLDNQPFGKKAISEFGERNTVSCYLGIVHYTILHGCKA